MDSILDSRGIGVKLAETNTDKMTPSQIFFLKKLAPAPTAQFFQKK
jgi:hypothetical protein